MNGARSLISASNTQRLKINLNGSTLETISRINFAKIRSNLQPLTIRKSLVRGLCYLFRTLCYRKNRAGVCHLFCFDPWFLRVISNEIRVLWDGHKCVSFSYLTDQLFICLLLCQFRIGIPKRPASFSTSTATWAGCCRSGWSTRRRLPFWPRITSRWRQRSEEKNFNKKELIGWCWLFRAHTPEKCISAYIPQCLTRYSLFPLKITILWFYPWLASTTYILRMFVYAYTLFEYFSTDILR